jgi:hypothetical protein
MLREILDKTAVRLDGELKGQPEVEGDLRATLGEVYRALSEYGQAEAMHRQALAIARKEFPDPDERTISCLGNLAMALDAQRKMAEGVLTEYRGLVESRSGKESAD